MFFVVLVPTTMPGESVVSSSDDGICWQEELFVHLPTRFEVAQATHIFVLELQRQHFRVLGALDPIKQLERATLTAF